MKKIHSEKKIIQYSLEGKILKIFENKRDAHNQTLIHMDSIIACCLGKYKTAGGFIFRFEGDSFNKKVKTSNISKNIILCKICNSEETIRSFAGHLRWVHPNYDTQKYIEEFGEFRPNYIKQNKLKEESSLKCEICGEKMINNRQLMHHITKKHKEITKEDYIVKYIYNNKPPLCSCGCGQPTTLLPNGKNCDLKKDTYSRDYIKGHWDWPVFSNIQNQSKEETELIDFIKSIYKGEILTSVRTIANPHEIDIYLPELKIAIEYNGLYWHSEANNIGKYYHINKTQKCKEKNIRLIHIFSDEWLGKKDIVKNKLSFILGLNQKTKIYARKCIIKEIKDTKIKKEFLEKNHIQGNDKSKIKLGLYYNETLVAIMTFSNPRIALGGKPHTNKWELSRYATSEHIIGGASKLLKYFIKNYKPQEIYSYSDIRWSDSNNNMYLKLGFKYIHDSQPGYYYTKNYTERLHRFNFRKNRLKFMGVKDLTKTEEEITKELGYYRVWDCGVSKYELKIY